MEYETERNDWKAFHESGRGDALGWGLIFLWGALVLLIEITTNVEALAWWDGWAVFFIGFGMVALSGAVVWLQIGNSSKAVWNGFFGLMALGFGISVIIGTDLFWVVALVGIAVVLVYVAFNGNWNDNDSD